MSTGIGLQDVIDLQEPQAPQEPAPPSPESVSQTTNLASRILGEDYAPSDGMPDTVTVGMPTIHRAAPLLGQSLQDPLGLGQLAAQQPLRNVVPQTAPTINFAPIPKSEPLQLGALPGQQEQRLGLAGTIAITHPELNGDTQRIKDVVDWVRSQPDPEAALRSLVTPAFDPFTRGADFVNKLLSPVERGINKIPIVGLPGGGMGGLGGYHGKTVGESDPLTKFIYQSLPYVAADAAAGGALTPAYLANAGLQATAISDRYAAGEISGKQAIGQLAMNVGPFVIGPLLHGLGAAAEGLTAFHDSPAGQAFVRKLQEIHANEQGGGNLFPGENPEQARFTPEGEITSERQLQGDRGQQGDLMGAPAQTGEGLTTESAGPMFAPPAGMRELPPAGSGGLTTEHLIRNIDEAIESGILKPAAGAEPVTPDEMRVFDMQRSELGNRAANGDRAARAAYENIVKDRPSYETAQEPTGAARAPAVAPSPSAEPAPAPPPFKVDPDFPGPYTVDRIFTQSADPAKRVSSYGLIDADGNVVPGTSRPTEAEAQSILDGLPKTPQEPAGAPPAPPSTEPSAAEPAAPAAQPGPDRAAVPEVGRGYLPADTNDPYFEQAPPDWHTLPDRPSQELELRRQQIEQELAANPMTPHTGAVRTVHRFREDTGAAAGRGAKRRGQMVDQIAVSDSTYAKIKSQKESRGLRFHAERGKQGGWWVDYEDELHGLDAQIETAHAPSVDQLKQAIALKAELKDVTREIRSGNPDEQMTSTDAAHLLRDNYHLLYHDVLNNAADEETAQMFGDVAQAYEDTMAAVRAGDHNMPASARRVLGLAERAKLDLNAAATTEPVAPRPASPATEYAREPAANGGVAAPADQGGQTPARTGAIAAAQPTPEPAAALTPPSNAGAAQPPLLTAGEGGAPPPPRTPVRTGGTGGGSGEVLPPVNEKFIRTMQQAVITPSERARLLREGRSRQAGGIVSAAKGQGTFAERQAAAGARASGQILPDFRAIGEKFTPEEMAQLHGQIDQALADNRISSFQWKTAGGAFERIMLGGREPQPAERTLLAQIFGPEFEAAIPKGPEQWKLWHEITGALGVPQAFSTSFDLSAPLRQGAVLGASHPFLWAGSFPAMVRAASSEGASMAIDAAIRERNPWVKGVGELDGYGFEDVGGHLSSLDKRTETNLREGQYASLNRSFISRTVQKFPGIRQSERGFVTMLNKLRADVYASEAARMWQAGERDTAQYGALAKTINHATGWGDFEVGQITGGINAFFSPRNLTARFQVVLDPIMQPGSLLKPSARQLAAKNLIAFAGVNAAVLGLVKMTGLADVELDPRSTDWGKMRIGNMRIDLMAGYAPLVRLVARLSPAVVGGGLTKTATGTFTAVDRKQLVLDFLRGKLGPVPGLVIDAFTGSNFVGQKTDLRSPQGIRTQLYNSFVPFVVQDVHDALTQQGIGAAAVGGTVGFFGGGVTSYANPSRDLLEARDAWAQRTTNPATKQPYKDFADATTALGANAAAAQAASDSEVKQAQATLDQNPSPFKAVQQNFAADQQQADAQYQSDHNISAWKDARTRIQQGEASQLALLKQQNGGTLPSSGDKVLDGYYALFADFTNPKTGIVLDKQGLGQALDEYVAKLPAADQARVDANTGLKGSPTEQAYRSAVKQLADAKFFDQEKMGYQSAYWQKLFAGAKTPLAPNGLMPDKFNSLGAMKASYVAAYVKRNGGDAQVAAADAGREFERIAAVRQFRNDYQKHVETFYKSNPDLLRLATQWGFNTLSKAEEKILSGAAR